MMYDFECSNQVQTAATAHKRGQSINFASIINTAEVWKAIYSTCIIHFCCKCKCIRFWIARVGPHVEPGKRESGSGTAAAPRERQPWSPRQQLRLNDAFSQTKHGWWRQEASDQPVLC